MDEYLGYALYKYLVSCEDLRLEEPIADTALRLSPRRGTPDSAHGSDHLGPVGVEA